MNRVRVFRNLHKQAFSVQFRVPRGWRTFAWCLSVDLEDVTFRVMEAGRLRAVREGVRNVHAFVEGSLTAWSGVRLRACADNQLPAEGKLTAEKIDWKTVAYNPFHHTTFVTEGKPCLASRNCALRDGRRVLLPHPIRADC